MLIKVLPRFPSLDAGKILNVMVKKKPIKLKKLMNIERQNERFVRQ